MDREELLISNFLELNVFPHHCLCFGRIRSSVFGFYGYDDSVPCRALHQKAQPAKFLVTVPQTPLQMLKMLRSIRTEVSVPIPPFPPFKFNLVIKSGALRLWCKDRPKVRTRSPDQQSRQGCRRTREPDSYGLLVDSFNPQLGLDHFHHQKSQPSITPSLYTFDGIHQPPDKVEELGPYFPFSLANMAAMFSQNPLMNGPNYSFSDVPKTTNGDVRERRFSPYAIALSLKRFYLTPEQIR
jgi:hypothetical protein